MKAPKATGILLAVLALAAAVPLRAQNAPAADQPAAPAQPQGDKPQGVDAGQAAVVQANADQNEQQQEDTPGTGMQTAPVPLALDMGSGALDFTEEATRKNFFQGGVSVGATYDSNLLSTSSPTIGGFTYSVLPNMDMELGGRRLSMHLEYAGGYVVNQRFSAYNEASHNASLDLHYRLSPHVMLRIHDQFARTPHLTDQLPENAITDGVGAIQQPNPTLVQPLVREQDNTGTAQISYQYSASDVVGAGVTSYITKFGQPPVATPTTLIDTESYEGNAFYNHRFTPRNWGGITYSVQRFAFTPGSTTVLSHSILALYTIYLRQGMQLEFFAGPEYSDLHTQILTTVVTPPTTTVTAVPSIVQSWSTNGGATFTWQAKRTSINASASRRISDGAGVSGAVELITATAGARWQVTRTATFEVNTIYGDSSSLDKAASFLSKVSSASANLIWTQHVTRNFIATLGYTQEYQRQETSLPPSQVINHSRAWFTLGYEFGRSLGR